MDHVAEFMQDDVDADVTDEYGVDLHQLRRTVRPVACDTHRPDAVRLVALDLEAVLLVLLDHPGQRLVRKRRQRTIHFGLRPASEADDHLGRDHRPDFCVPVGARLGAPDISCEDTADVRLGKWAWGAAREQNQRRRNHGDAWRDHGCSLVQSARLQST
jgi:hypothetical protein